MRNFFYKNKDESENNLSIPQLAFENGQIFLKRRNVQGRILFVMLGGSQTYNLQTPESDMDYLGVYLAPTQELLTFKESTVHTTSFTSLPTDPKPDFSFHEAKHYCQLLLKGNPFALETLFANEKYCYVTEEWKQLYSMRNIFLTQVAVEQHLFYIEGQIQKHQQKPMVPKRYYHVLRLLYQVKRIIEGEQPIVFLEGEEQQEMMKVKLGEDPMLQPKIEETLKYIYSKKPWNNLPPKPDESAIEDWLIRVRKEDLFSRNP